MPTTITGTAAGGRLILTLEEVLDELQIARSTLDSWRRTKRFPAFRRLPNGQLRLERAVLEKWIADQREAA